MWRHTYACSRFYLNVEVYAHYSRSFYLNEEARRPCSGVYLNEEACRPCRRVYLNEEACRPCSRVYLNEEACRPCSRSFYLNVEALQSCLPE